VAEDPQPEVVQGHRGDQVEMQQYSAAVATFSVQAEKMNKIWKGGLLY
jgi:hypothetical protein